MWILSSDWSSIWTVHESERLCQNSHSESTLCFAWDQSVLIHAHAVNVIEKMSNRYTLDSDEIDILKRTVESNVTTECFNICFHCIRWVCLRHIKANRRAWSHDEKDLCVIIASSILLKEHSHSVNYNANDSNEECAISITESSRSHDYLIISLWDLKNR